MKINPFRNEHQDLESLYREQWAKFEPVRKQAELLYKPPKKSDLRRGFGTVGVMSPSERMRVNLIWWGWRPARRDWYPEWAGAEMFIDDPLGALPSDNLDLRLAKATAVAVAAGKLFPPEDGRFVARPLEIVHAAAGAPLAVHRGEDTDAIMVDLMLDTPLVKIVDRLVADLVEDDRRRGFGSSAEFMRQELWFRAERLNAARAMFDPDARLIKIPGIPSIRRRVDALENADRQEPSA